MFLRRVAPFVFAVSFALVLAACDEPSGQSSAFPRSAAFIDPEAYGALPWVFPVVHKVRIDNEFGGDIIVTEHEVPNAQEVALDYTAFSTGPDLVQAAADARRAVDVKMDYDAPNGEVIILAIGSAQQQAQAGQGVRLHVRVPSNVNLDLTTRAGRITVSGAVKNVMATATDRIDVHGAVGSLTLMTTGGGIVADGGNGQRIETRAQNGNTTIFSTDVKVTAAVTGTGGIEFVGTLAGRDNTFLTYTGPITIALPEDVSYSFYARAPSGRVLTDFRPRRPGTTDGRPVCGFVRGGQAYDYHVRYVDDLYSHLDINFANAGNYLSGTLDANAYFLFTDRSDITVYTPLPETIHIFSDDGRESVEVNRPGQPLGTTECNTPPPQTDVRFTASTQSGMIFIHHILMRRQ